MLNRLWTGLFCFAVGVAFTGIPAQAQTPAEVLNSHLTSGRLGEAVKALTAATARDPASAEARMALGFAQFAAAVERLGQSLHRYGLMSASAPYLPVLRMPVPENPKPERLDYQKMRAVYVQLLADLAAVDQTLARMPAGEPKLVIDLFAIRLDLNGDGRISDDERLGNIVIALGMGPRGAMVPRPGGSAPPAEAAEWVVAFDRADALWLRGYSRLLSAFVEFVLAHDWHETYDATAHLFFAGAVDASNPMSLPDADGGMMGREGRQIADYVAFLHLARWPVVEPERMKAVRTHLKAVVALSRETWAAVLAETDDDREWLPAPHQKNRAVTALAVGEEQVKGWLAALDEFDAVLDGRKLVPHWRHQLGFDLRQVLEEPRPFDVVLWLTGHAARPYLKSGEMISQATWRQWQRIFSGNFLAYAFWFN